jgi:hypothetical protein
MSEVIGKLSDDWEMSCSRLPGLLGLSPWNSPIDELAKSIRAWDAKKAGRDPREDRDPAGEAAAWGNKLEDPILEEGAARLGLAINTRVLERFECKDLPLQGSMDGILEGDGRVIEHDPAAGIYVLGGSSVTLDGPGVAEAKLTRVGPMDTPAAYRGPVQVQGLMMCSGYQWAAIFTLYQGTELRIYLTGPDAAMQAKIREDVIDFDARMELYTTQGVTDWYPALTPNDAASAYAKPENDLPPVDFDGEHSQLVMDLIAAKAAEKASRELADKISTRLMDFIGMHPGGLAKDDDGVVFAEVSWPMTGPRKAYSVEAKPAARAKSLRVKELTL